MQVFKFGGASVRDATAIHNIKNIISTYDTKKLLVVVSAIGKTTNALEAILHAYFNKMGNSFTLLRELKSQHDAIVAALIADTAHPVYNALNNKFVELEWLLEEEPIESYDYLYDQIVGVGEYLSTIIVSHYLNYCGIHNQWIDARDLIRTDNNYREGHVDIRYSEQLTQALLPNILCEKIVITQGFIGGTSENYITTLGREGSDYSAAIFSNLLNADRMTVWKDVPGVMNADPRIFDFAILLRVLSYHEAIEMTYYGASVIHPKTIKPLQNKKIPLYVRSFVNPNVEGTIIHEVNITDFPPIVVLKKNQVLASIATTNYSFMNEKNLTTIYHIFTQHKTRINTSQQSAMTFSVCFDKDNMKLNPLLDELKKHFDVKINEAVELITIRHYTKEMINRLLLNRTLLLEQKSRYTVQFVLK